MIQRPVGNKLHKFFLVHGVFNVVVGAALLLVPGLTLALLGWVPDMILLPDPKLSAPGVTVINPIIVRLLGAALIAFGYASLRATRVSSWLDVRLLVELQGAFHLFGLIALLISAWTLDRPLPLLGWIIIALFAALGAAWTIALYRRAARPRARRLVDG